MSAKKKKQTNGPEPPKLIQYKCNYCGSKTHQKLFDAVHRGSTFSVVRCKCNLSFMNPRPSEDELDKYYDRDYYSGPEKEFTSWSSFPPDLSRDVVDFPEIEFTGKGRFLDIGCGIGVHVAYMKGQGWKAKGLDISKYSVEFGRREKGLDLFCGTLQEANYPDEYFDFIYMRDVIEHLGEPQETLREVARILRPEGTFVLTTGNIGSVIARLRQDKWFYLQMDHIHYFSLASLQRMLNKVGLDIIKLGSEYCYGRSISEMKRLNAPRFMVRVPEYIINTKLAPGLYRYFGSKIAELFTTTMVLHIKKIRK